MARPPGNPARTGPSRRPPPLLVLAAAGLLAVIGTGAVLIVTRGVSSPETARSAPSGAAPEDIERPSQGRSPDPPAIAPTLQVSAPTIAAPAPAPAKSVREVIAETGEIPEGTRPEDLPIWARPPRVTTQPFPEGGRIDPPLPPVHIPVEMLEPAPPRPRPPGAEPPAR